MRKKPPKIKQTQEQPQESPQEQQKKRSSLPVMSREDIIGRLKNDVISVEIPGWGASVRVRPPTFPDICQLRAQAPDDADFKATLAIQCCVDLKPEDMRIMREGNGIRFAELSSAIYDAFNAVMGVASGN